MDASLPILPVATDTPGSLSGLGADLHGKQLDRGAYGGFGRMLDQAHTALSAATDSSPAQSLEAGKLIRQLQLLPQGGKLLPLLQQVLDGAATRGVDPQQVLARIAAQLEQLGSNTDLEPAEAIATALQQLVDETAALPAPAVSTALTVVAEGDESATGARPGDAPLERTLARNPSRPAGAVDTMERMPFNDTHRETTSYATDRALLQSQQTAQAPHQGQTELATVLAAIRRLNGDGKPALADSPLRPESIASPVSSAVAPTTSATATSGLPTLNLATPFNQGGWDQALGERIQWMVSQKLQGAQLKLNPAHLGPMEVRVQMNNDQASIQFTSAHAVVREALETALPRLREMFESAAVELVDVDISDQSSAERQRTGAEPAVAGRHRDEDQDADAEMLLESPLAGVLNSSRIDLFA